MLPELDALKSALIGTEFEDRLWLVGGFVRDELLGIALSADVDLVTDLDSHKLAAMLFDRGLCGPPQIYPRFRTAMVRIGGLNLEFVTARKESYAHGSRKPEVKPGTLLQDAQRRDFTVNALMKSLFTGEILDLLGCSLADLNAKVLRTPLDPEVTFGDDPLRMLRAVRFRQRLGFDYARELAAALKAQASRLEIVSAERIHEELAKMLVAPGAEEALKDLMDFGLLDMFAPEFRAMKGVEQGRFHHLDVWDHSCLVVKNAGPGDEILTLAALCHDIGKPATRAIDADGNTRFFGHETVGAEMTRNLLRRLKWSSSDIEAVALLVKNHMRLGSFETFTPSAARRLVRDMGEMLDRLLKLVEADAASLKTGVKVLDLVPIRERLAKVRVQTPAETLHSPLDGEEIMSLLGLEPGAKVGEVKAWLSEQVIEGVLAPGDVEAARRLVVEQIRKGE